MPASPVNEEVATTAGGYGRAFGRIQYVEDGNQTLWSTTLLRSDSLTLFVRSVQTQEMQYLQVEEDGTFYWPHRAGEYEMVGYQVARVRGSATTRNSSRLMTKYSIPEAGRAVYIGDLRIESSKSRSGFQVMDRFVEAEKRVESRLASAKLEAVKGLMRFEQQPGIYKTVTRICDSSWGLNCDSTYQGVQPLEPQGTADGFPLTQKLAPLLQWTPSNKAGVSYDVAIYESMMLTYGTGRQGNARLRGTLVDYAEGLSQPMYSPVQALQPGKQYEWTVRLRNGDTVSSVVRPK